MEEASQQSSDIVQRLQEKVELTKQRIMEEASRQSSDIVQRLPEEVELTKQQKDIYEFLLREKLQRAYTIAKAMGKTRASDVNPDLYKMQGWNLLECNEDKLWSIKAESHASEHQHKTRPTTSGPLTVQQKEIIALLRKNRPMKAMDIAKGVGKTKAKEVNPDLYAMIKMNHLIHKEKEKLWTVRCQEDTRCTERNEDSEEQRRSSISSDSNHTDDSTSLNQSEIENQDNQFCNGSQYKNATVTGIPSPDHQFENSKNRTQTIGPNTVQNYANAIHPNVVKYYNINIQNSQCISVGDTLIKGGWSQERGPAAGLGSQDATLGPEQQVNSEEADGTQDDSMNNFNIANPEGRPLHTSSPADHGQSQQRINISFICDGIEQLDLEEQDIHIS